MQMNWDDARIFLAIARTGTLTAAAKQLGLGIATISRRLERLEQVMPMALFSRHQSGYQLTNEGELLLSYAETLESAAFALNEAAKIQNNVAGLVRLAVAENLANTLIIPSLNDLFSLHPDLSVEINSATELSNLHRRDADLAIRTIKPETGNLTIKKLGQLTFGFYTSVGYAEAIQQQDLTEDQYRYIGWDEMHQHLETAQYLHQHLKGRPCSVMTNHLSTQIHAVKSGLGIGFIPKFIALDLDLIPIAAEFTLEQPIWLAVHSNLLSSKRVRTVADHLSALFEQHRDRL